MFAGCAVGPNYSRPAVPAQAAWKEGATATNATVLPPNWWHIFSDEELNALEGEAIKANQDLALAVARVTEARALARGAAAEFYPNISSRGTYSRNHLSENLVRVPNQDLNADYFAGTFDFDYELDVWGARATFRRSGSG